MSRAGAAERFDPPLVVRRFTLGAQPTLDALLAEASACLAGTGADAGHAFQHGGIHVNGRPLAPESAPRALPEGAWVVVYAFAREPEPIPLDPARVLFDGEGLVAVDKPPWLPMQRTRASARFSLEASLRALLGDDALVAVHRLDRQTSGVALFARGRSGAWATRALAERRVGKRYLAVVAPAPERDAFEASGWIARSPHPSRFRFALSAAELSGSRWSRTRFRVLERGPARALLEARPETGRTHQIRVHLAALGAPIAGDDLYGACASDAERVLLHAAALTLPRADGSTLSIEAAPPDDLLRAI